MTSRPSRRRLLRRLGQVAAWAVAVGAVILLWPANLGGCTTITIVTGHSMESTLQPGDLAVTRCGTPQVGDVVAYRPFPDKNPVVIHRIIGGDPVSGWLLQGDNNNFVDPFRPVAAQVRGIMVLSMPKIGGVVAFVGSPIMWSSMLLIAAALLLWPHTERPTSKPAPTADEPAEDIAREEVDA